MNNENLHIKRLEEKGIIIEDIYKNNFKKFIRYSDGRRIDHIQDCSRFMKKYYYNNKLLYKTNKFHKNFKYTINEINEDNKIKCANCNTIDNLKNFYDGCIYCGMNLNTDFVYKKYDIHMINDIINMNLYRLILIAISIIIIFVINVLKPFKLENLLYSIIAFPILILFIYIISMIIISPIVIIKNKNNKCFFSKNFINKKIDINKVISSIHYELNNYYYSNSNYIDLIDYDIIRYKEFNDLEINNQISISVSFVVREYYFKDGKLKKNITNKTMKLIKNDNMRQIDNRFISVCKECGADLDLTRNYCDYCGTQYIKSSYYKVTSIE